MSDIDATLAAVAMLDTKRGGASPSPTDVEWLASMAPELAQEVDRLRSKACPPLVWQSNGEAGDGQSVCEACGTELDEPHTWRECMAIQREDRRRDDEHVREYHAEEIERLRGEVAAAHSFVADFCDVAEMAATQHDGGGMRVSYHGDFASAVPSVRRDLAAWAKRGRELLVAKGAER